MLNVVVLIGRLTRAMELRYTPTGTAVASGCIAVERPFKNQNGEKETDFIDIVLWRQSAEFAAKYGDKGRMVAVRGRLALRSYEAQDGTKRRVAEVVADEFRLLDRPKEQGAQGQGGGGFDPDDPDGDVPF